MIKFEVSIYIYQNVLNINYFLVFKEKVLKNSIVLPTSNS